ncbi:hypothetical protein [Flagellimonas pacifica]|uniref:DUF481 domain-containing protein n=1 Tax=Flagellimonas pacifica TaxID=1247520 RepID=A0A285MCN3_9FLAO|nr:hypothetical protein [Allomuricauda parva]SNY94889.1 hypothetical protein SAMN06265377_0550 [Allomuricauda parva]
MRIKLLLLISIFTLLYTNGFSQTNTDPQNNSLELSTGFNSGSLKNLEFAPVSRYDYNGLFYSLNYERKTRNENLFEIRADYLATELESDAIPQLNTDYSKIGLGFSYLKQIFDKNAFSIHLGLQSQTTASLYRDNYYLVDQEFGVASRFTYQLNRKQHLASKLTVPLVLIRLRGDVGLDGYLLNRYQSALWNLEYGYSISNNFGLRLSYDFKYNRLQIPNAFRELQHQVNLGINYKF